MTETNGDLITIREVLANYVPPTEVEPFNLEAERGFLCSLLRDENAFVHAAGLRPSDFFQKEHVMIFMAMQDVIKDGDPIDTITVLEKLLSQGRVLQDGDAIYLAQLEVFRDLLPTSVMAKPYAKIIKEHSKRRQLVAHGQRLAKSGSAGNISADDLLEDVEKTISAFKEKNAENKDADLSDIVDEALRIRENISLKRSSMQGLPSNFSDLDQITGGFRAGELTIIAARPGMGKTAFALNIAANISLRLKKTVSFFSLEMDPVQIANRLLISESGVSDSMLINCKTGEMMSTTATTAGLLSEQRSLHIEGSRGGVAIQDIRSRIKTLKEQTNIEIVFIDYLGLMSTGGRYENKTIEIGEISKGLKNIAKEFGISVVALSQLNRGVESRTDKRPMMSDLRDSGNIEEDADLIMFLYREEYYTKNKTSDDKIGTAEVIVSKNRNGAIGSFEIGFDGSLGRFGNKSLWS